MDEGVSGPRAGATWYQAVARMGGNPDKCEIRPNIPGHLGMYCAIVRQGRAHRVALRTEVSAREGHKVGAAGPGGRMQIKGKLEIPARGERNSWR